MFRRTAAILKSTWRTRLTQRALLTMFLLVAGLLAIYLHRTRQQQRAVSAIRRIGGTVAYDYQLTGDLVYSHGQSWVPAGLRQQMGDDWFHSVIFVQVLYRDDPLLSGKPGPENDEFLAGLDEFPALESVELRFGPQTEEGLRQLGRLRRLKHLTLKHPGDLTDGRIGHIVGLEYLESICLNDTDITDESIRLLGQLPRLSNLDVRHNRLTDQCLKYAGRMQPLKMLWVGGWQENESITDQGLVHLVNLQHLEVLDLQGTSVTEAGVERLSDLELKCLGLQHTKVRDADRLRQVFPGCYIAL